MPAPRPTAPRLNACVHNCPETNSLCAQRRDRQPVTSGLKAGPQIDKTSQQSVGRAGQQEGAPSNSHELEGGESLTSRAGRADAFSEIGARESEACDGKGAELSKPQIFVKPCVTRA